MTSAKTPQGVLTGAEMTSQNHTFRRLPVFRWKSTTVLTYKPTNNATDSKKVPKNLLSTCHWSPIGQHNFKTKANLISKTLSDTSIDRYVYRSIDGLIIYGTEIDRSMDTMTTS